MDLIEASIHDLTSRDHSVREAAAKMLFDRKSEAQRAVPPLLATLLEETDACPWVGTALVAIITDAEVSDAVLEGLRSALLVSNSQVRFWAARALVKLGPAAQPAIPELIRLIVDREYPVRDSAVWALASIGEASIAPLSEAAGGDDIDLAAMALFALGRYSTHVSLKLQTVFTALDDDRLEIRRAAAHAVCSLLQDFHRQSEYTAAEFEVLRPLHLALRRIDSDSKIDIDRDWIARIERWYADKLM